jgi:murein DD-endopeptidase MepM/ murein hydrolase activator NlpD
VGLVGSTGASTGPHLHFEIRLEGRSVDPLGYLQVR